MRPIGDALLDQRTIAGIGNLWKCEGCFAAGVDPWRPTGEVSDDEALRIVRLTRPRMQESASDGHQARHRMIYGRTGRPCPRCGATIAVRGQGDDNRPTYWCPGCQR
jgi:endonuclease VIII